jgi:hypothetical protein
MSTFIPLTVHDVHWGPTLDDPLQRRGKARQNFTAS